MECTPGSVYDRNIKIKLINIISYFLELRTFLICLVHQKKKEKKNPSY